MRCNVKQCSTIQYNAVYNPMRCHTMQCNTLHCHTSRYNTILQRSTMQCNAMQYRAMQYHNTILYNPIQDAATRYDTMPCNAIRSNAMQSNAVQYATRQVDNTESHWECRKHYRVRHNSIQHKHNATRYNCWGHLGMGSRESEIGPQSKRMCVKYARMVMLSMTGSGQRQHEVVKTCVCSLPGTHREAILWGVTLKKNALGIAFAEHTVLWKMRERAFSIAWHCLKRACTFSR